MAVRKIGGRGDKRYKSYSKRSSTNKKRFN